MKNQIREIQIVNQFNNGKIYRVGQPELHFTEDHMPIQCKIIEIEEKVNKVYHEYIVKIQDLKQNIYYKRLRDVSVLVEYY